MTYIVSGGALTLTHPQTAVRRPTPDLFSYTRGILLLVKLLSLVMKFVYVYVKPLACVDKVSVDKLITMRDSCLTLTLSRVHDR